MKFTDGDTITVEGVNELTLDDYGSILFICRHPNGDTAETVKYRIYAQGQRMTKIMLNSLSDNELEKSKDVLRSK